MKSKLVILFTLLFAGCSTQNSAEHTNPQVSTTAVIPITKNFSGHWELDYGLTEDPMDKLRWLYEVARAQVDQVSRRDQSRGMSPQTMRAIDDLNGVISLGTLTESMTRSTVLDIRQSRDYVVVEREGDFALTCDLFSQEQEVTFLGEERCGIGKNGDLVFTVSLPEGLSVSNRLVLSADGKRLNVATTFFADGLSQPFSLNKVYVPFEPGRDRYSCEYSLEKKNVCWLRSESSSITAVEDAEAVEEVQ